MKQNNIQKEKKNKKRLPLTFKLLFSFLGFTAAIISFLIICQMFLLEEFYLHTTKGTLQGAVGSLSNVSLSELQEECDKIALETDMCVLVYDNSGKQLASSDASGRCLIHKLGNFNLNELYDSAIKAGGTVIRPIELEGPYGKEDGGYWASIPPDAPPVDIDDDYVEHYRAEPNDFELSRLICASVVNTDEGTRFILADCNLEPVGVLKDTLSLQLSVASLVAIIVSLIAAILLSRRLARPLCRLSRKTAQLANGDYSASFEGGGCREIDALSESLNFAAGELSKVNEMQKRLIANVSHDLRTPLTMISGYAEVMRDIPGENSPENIQVILDETARLTALVNDLIDLSKINSAEYTPKPERFSLSELVESTADRFKRLNECKGYTINFRADGECFVYADRSGILQVLYNLIGNALAYTGEDRNVYVTLSEENGNALVEIRDTGKGIAPEELESTWERYYRSQENHLRGVGGSGLGLSIVKEILTAHGTEFGVKSTLGKGSTFYFMLPIL